MTQNHLYKGNVKQNYGETLCIPVMKMGEVSAAKGMELSEALQTLPSENL